MSAGPGLKSTVVAARQRLVAGRDQLRRQHDSGSPGVQVCAHLTDLLEAIVLDLFQSALDDLDEPTRKRLANSTALLAHSGFGRRETAPYSDIDLKLLHPFVSEQTIVPLTRRFTQHLYDL